MMRKVYPAFLPLALLLWGCAVFPALAGIAFDESSKTITLSTSNLQMQINTDEMCVLDRMVLDGVEVVSPPQPVFSGVQIAGQWYTSMKTASPTVVVDGDTVTLRGIRFGPDTAPVEETWLFTMIDNQISWRIERTYTQPATLDDTVMPAWDFSSMTTWEGAILDHGGVAWCRFLDQPHTTYGCQAQTVTLWHPADDRCLRIEPRLEPSQHMAVRFTHQPEGAFRYASVLTPEPLKPKHNLSRFLHARSDLWAPFQVEAGKLAVDYILTPLRYSQAYNRGTFVGIDGPLVNAILDTIARYGVIDRNIVGSNGWRTGYKCLHEPWFAQMALAIADPDYTQNLQDSLNYERDHAIQPDGRVKSRFFFNDADAMPGTFDSLGYYEAQWGYLLDSQADFVINVAELFDLNGDLNWVRSQKETCEKVLAYMLRRDSDGNGLVEVIPQTHREGKASDWIDIVWASYETAYINAGMYYALTLWADIEALLGDHAKAQEYRDGAARMKAAFNQPVDQGGFWNPANQWYVYWREEDGSFYGDNLVTPVNFMAIAYGLCDEPQRIQAILDQIETLTQAEDLFYWPLCFFSYKREEVHDNNWPFPRYENGDLFLAFGEVAARAYAPYKPEIALKYVRNVLTRYQQDGLAHQRYARRGQEGLGDDILANNSLPVVGLFRNLYGIQPKYNRLVLDPHLPADLAGSNLRYSLRGEEYQISYLSDTTSVTVGGYTLASPRPFAISLAEDGVLFYEGIQNQPAMKILSHGSQPVNMTMQQWSKAEKRWQMQGSVKWNLYGLEPDARYKITVSGDEKLQNASSEGQIELELTLPTGGVVTVNRTAIE